MKKSTSPPPPQTGLASKLPGGWLLVAIAVFVAAVTFAAVYFASMRSNQYVAPPCPTDNCVALFSDGATPSVLTIKNGEYVQFNSADGKPHNISLAHSAAQSDDASTYASGEFKGDEAWRVQFKKDGAYSFRDTRNAETYINVVVYTAGKAYKVD